MVQEDTKNRTELFKRASFKTRETFTSNMDLEHKKKFVTSISVEYMHFMEMTTGQQRHRNKEDSKRMVLIRKSLKINMLAIIDLHMRKTYSVYNYLQWSRMVKYSEGSLQKRGIVIRIDVKSVWIVYDVVQPDLGTPKEP